MHKGARHDPTLSFAKFKKFHNSSTTFVSCFFSSVRLHKYIKYNNMGRLCYGRLCYVLSGFGCLSCLFIFLTLLSPCNYYKNKIFINSHSLTCFFSDERHEIATVFYFMGRLCYGPRCSGTQESWVTHPDRL